MAYSNYTSASSSSSKTGVRHHRQKPPKPPSIDDLSIPRPSSHHHNHQTFSDEASSIYTEISPTYDHHPPQNRPRLPPIPPSSHWLTSFYSAYTDPSLNINIITVAFNISCPLPLGIYIELRRRSPCNGIYISKITPNSLAARDRRIRPGMLVLKVNGHPLDGMHPEKAVNFFREAAHPKNGRIELTCFDGDDSGRLSDFNEHAALGGIDKLSDWQKRSKAPSIVAKRRLNSIAEEYCNPVSASPSSTFTTTYKTDSSIEIRPLKRFQPTEKKLITVAMANKSDGLPRKHFIAGKKCFTSDELIDWLHKNVEGFDKMKEIERFAAEMIKHGYISQVVDKSVFSKLAYFAFTDKIKALQSDRLTVALATGKTPMMDDTLPAAPTQKGFVSRIKKLLCSQPQHNTTEWPPEVPRGSSHRSKKAKFSLSMPQFQRSLSISSSRTHACVSESSGSGGSSIELLETDTDTRISSKLFDI